MSPKINTTEMDNITTFVNKILFNTCLNEMKMDVFRGGKPGMQQFVDEMARVAQISHVPQKNQ